MYDGQCEESTSWYYGLSEKRLVMNDLNPRPLDFMTKVLTTRPHRIHWNIINWNLIYQRCFVFMKRPGKNQTATFARETYGTYRQFLLCPTENYPCSVDCWCCCPYWVSNLALSTANWNCVVTVSRREITFSSSLGIRFLKSSCAGKDIQLHLKIINVPSRKTPLHEILLSLSYCESLLLHRSPPNIA